MNTEHFRRIWRITLNRQFFTPSSSSAGSWPWRRSRTHYFTHTALCNSDEYSRSSFTLSLALAPLRHTLSHLWAVE